MILGIGTFRISKYLCLKLSWVSFIPIINVYYMMWVADRLMYESMLDSESKAFIISCIATVVGAVCLGASSLCPVFFISMVWISVSVIFGCWVYGISAFFYVGLRHPVICLIASLMIFAPVIILISSFRIPQEVSSLYLEQ